MSYTGEAHFHAMRLLIFVKHCFQWCKGTLLNFGERNSLVLLQLYFSIITFFWVCESGYNDKLAPSLPRWWGPIKTVCIRCRRKKLVYLCFSTDTAFPGLRDVFCYISLCDRHMEFFCVED